MLPYIDIHTERLLMIAIYGAIIFFGVILIMGARTLVVSRSRGKIEDSLSGEEAGPGGPRPEAEHDLDLMAKEVHRPIPVLLPVLYVGVAIWAIFYVLAFVLWGTEWPA